LIDDWSGLSIVDCLWIVDCRLLIDDWSGLSIVDCLVAMRRTERRLLQMIEKTFRWNRFFNQQSTINNHQSSIQGQWYHL